MSLLGSNRRELLISVVGKTKTSSKIGIDIADNSIYSTKNNVPIMKYDLNILNRKTSNLLKVSSIEIPSTKTHLFIEIA